MLAIILKVKEIKKIFVTIEEALKGIPKQKDSPYVFCDKRGKSNV